MDVEYYACYVGVKCTRFQFNWKIRSIKCYGDNDASKLLCQLSNASQHTVFVDGIYQTEAWIAESQTRKTDKSYHHERATKKKKTSWLMKRYSCNGWYAWWKLAVEKSGNFFFFSFIDPLISSIDNEMICECTRRKCANRSNHFEFC